VQVYKYIEYRTDEVGTVIVTTDGSKITVDKKASTIKENAPPKVTVPKETVSSSNKSYDDTPITTQYYIGNINTKKFHLPSCSVAICQQRIIKLY